MKVMGRFIPVPAHPEAAGSSGSQQWMLSLLKQGKYFCHWLGSDLNNEKNSPCLHCTALCGAMVTGVS